MANSILVLHGPNLNLLGRREPDVYGETTLPEIDAALLAMASDRGATLRTGEGALIDRVQAAPGEGIEFIIINPAALTHTSVALRDALAGVAIPFVEVHLSNVYRREAFRRHSYFSDLSLAVICGLGQPGYMAALQFALDFSD